MINKVFAQNFIRKIERTMNIKVNVMDERGVIIASSSAERIGDFHLCAFEIIENNLSIMITKEPTKELIGVNSPGVNLRLTSSGETIGVIGVSGNPDEVTDIARMVKLTFETMYEYEYKKNAGTKGAGSVWNLSHVLLVETPLNHFSIKKVSSRLNFSNNYPRIPLYIRIDTEYLSTVIQHFVDYYSTFSIYKSQDMVLPVEHGILLMKSFREEGNEFGDADFARACTTKLVTEFFSRQNNNIQSLTYQFYIGLVQTEFTHYQRMYQHLLWLASYSRIQSESCHFLADHVSELILELSGNEFLEPLFEYYAQLIEQKLDLNLFLETVRGLIDANMKLDDTAEMLHLHKNSVVARVNKIKELLHINPISNANDAATLRYIYSYIIKRKSKL